MTRDAKYSVIAFLSGILVGALLLTLELVGVDWAGLYRKWFGFVLWSALMFGLLGIAYGRRLRRAKALAVFLGLLLVHVVVFVLYLRSVERLPDTAFIFYFPLEGGLIGLVMTTLGGTRLPPGFRLRKAPQERPGEQHHRP
jgi:Na+/proline symporter